MTKREIKFRAWDKKYKKMVNVGQFLWAGALLILPEDYDETQVGTAKDYPLMQFTGLKDKNGKEIYEGDIVKESEYPKTSSYEVHWCSFGMWGLSNKDGDSYDNGDYYRGDDITWENFEVIGNIYENPELLKS